ncbi:MAG: HTH domain-containing protein [Christensenellaceae bacterium]
MTDNVGNMAREKRRERILAAIGSGRAASAGALGDRFGVSRQVIVQDIAVLRAEGAPIVSTNRGYILASKRLAARVFKVYHSEKELAEELEIIVNGGGTVKTFSSITEFTAYRGGAEYINRVQAAVCAEHRGRQKPSADGGDGRVSLSHRHGGARGFSTGSNTP